MYIRIAPSLDIFQFYTFGFVFPFNEAGKIEASLSKFSKGSYILLKIVTIIFRTFFCLF